MNEDIVVPAFFFGTIMVLSLGIPLVRAYVRRKDREAVAASLTPELALRLDRLEAMVETVAVEVERMAEGQRFTTRLLSEGAAAQIVPPARAPQTMRANSTDVTHA
jgi:hypothetical protein